MRDGTGVKLLTLIKAMAVGKWPFRAPTKKRRDDAKIAPLRAPNVEHATKKGIIQDMTPSNLSPNVYREYQKTLSIPAVRIKIQYSIPGYD